MGTAVPVYSNFAIHGIERVSRELRSALHRRNRELQAARREAEQTLRSELKDTITALLLSCELALDVPNLPLFAGDKGGSGRRSGEGDAHKGGGGGWRG